MEGGVVKFQTTDGAEHHVSLCKIADWETISLLIKDVGLDQCVVVVPDLDSATLMQLIGLQADEIANLDHETYFRLFHMVNYLDAKQLYYDFLPHLIPRLHEKTKELYASYKTFLPDAACFAPNAL